MIETPATNTCPPSVRVPHRPYLRLFGRRRHKMTRAGLRNLARARSEALADFVHRREARRPQDDAVIRDHEYPHRRVTLHDLETQRIYAVEYAAGLGELREQFAARGIRNGELNRYLASPENAADLRTISTALLAMAARLEK